MTLFDPNTRPGPRVVPVPFAGDDVLAEDEAGVPAEAALAQFFALFDDQATPLVIAVVSTVAVSIVVGSRSNMAIVDVLHIDVFQIIVVTLVGQGRRWRELTSRLDISCCSGLL